MRGRLRDRSRVACGGLRPPHPPSRRSARCAPLGPPTRPRISLCGGSAPTPPRGSHAGRRETVRHSLPGGRPLQNSRFEGGPAPSPLAGGRGLRGPPPAARRGGAARPDRIGGAATPRPDRQPAAARAAHGRVGTTASSSRLDQLAPGGVFLLEEEAARPTRRGLARPPAAATPIGPIVPRLMRCTTGATTPTVSHSWACRQADSRLRPAPCRYTCTAASNSGPSRGKSNPCSSSIARLMSISTWSGRPERCPSSVPLPSRKTIVGVPVSS